MARSQGNLQSYAAEIGTVYVIYINKQGFEI